MLGSWSTVKLILTIAIEIAAVMALKEKAKDCK